MTRSTLVDEITERIAFQIAAGHLRAGDRLPSIRRLAEEHEINPTTVQMVLARLRAIGFVEAHHGLGVVVCDIESQGGIETWRYLLRFSRRLPGTAARILRDLLETLAIFYESTIARIEKDPGAYDPRPARNALNRLDRLVASGSASAAEVHQGVLAVLRAGASALGGGILLGVLNSLGPMLGDVPEVLDAVYHDQGVHVWWWEQVVAAWETGDVAGARAAVGLLDAWHDEVTERLRRALESQVNG
ncbi:GntR family transcriptional regulator [Actinomadura atramentaria]|uniref:GntR family transcriptional regulator n=1 Tax=Actinomadura atramentaria TaxID=1990 RepID=UPI00037630A6|nr:GntR family transcriptional regulator [Actinomadura atramentaria]